MEDHRRLHHPGVSTRSRRRNRPSTPRRAGDAGRGAVGGKGAARTSCGTCSPGSRSWPVRSSPRSCARSSPSRAPRRCTLSSPAWSSNSPSGSRPRPRCFTRLVRRSSRSPASPNRTGARSGRTTPRSDSTKRSADALTSSDLPRPRRGHPTRRHGAGGAARRVGGRPPLHEHRVARQSEARGDRW